MVKQEDLKEILHRADLKITRSRLEVLKILYHTHKPITHTYIMEHLPEKDTWDRVTVYRTLSEFTEKKIIKSLPSNERFGVVLSKSGMLSVRNLGERAITLLTAKNHNAKNDKALLGEVATWSLKPASAGKAFRVGPRLKLT
jgi:Fe2+ or Zn2+ uptake regulation protein